MAEPLRTVIVGCGNRGQMFGRLCRKHPDLARVVAVAEPREDWRLLEADRNRVPPRHAYASFEPALGPDSPTPNLVIVASDDRTHYPATLLALKKGCMVLLEKPVAQTPAETVRLQRAAESKGLPVAVQHELRYSPFFQTVREIVQSGRIGRVYSYTHTEHVAYWHMTHSFVRGHFHNTRDSNPMILTKSSHDLDLIPWVLGDEVTRLSSFGRLDHFTPENRPEGAPERCTDGCPVGDTCIHNAEVFYLGPRTNWPVAMLGTDMSPEARRERLAESDYSLCVYGGHNDSVDHQTVSMETRRGTICTFTMQGFSAQEQAGRKIRLDGALGTLRGNMETGEIQVYEHVNAPYGRTVEPDVIRPGALGGHGGGDERLFVDTLTRFQSGDSEPLATLQNAVESHLLGYAAEESRLQGRVIDMADYRRRAAEEAEALT